MVERDLVPDHIRDGPDGVLQRPVENPDVRCVRRWSLRNRNATAGIRVRVVSEVESRDRRTGESDPSNLEGSGCRGNVDRRVADDAIIYTVGADQEVAFDQEGSVLGDLYLRSGGNCIMRDGNSLLDLQLAIALNQDARVDGLTGAEGYMRLHDGDVTSPRNAATAPRPRLLPVTVAKAGDGRGINRARKEHGHQERREGDQPH